MRLAVFAAALCLVSGCDLPGDEAQGSFALSLSGARTATLDGEAGFTLVSCRSLSLGRGRTQLFLAPKCDQDANGASRDRIRRGRFGVAPVRGDGTFSATFYDFDSGVSFRGTSGTVEITAESRERVAGRVDIEAHPINTDGDLESTATPLRIVGTFDASRSIVLD